MDLRNHFWRRNCLLNWESRAAELEGSVEPEHSRSGLGLVSLGEGHNLYGSADFRGIGWACSDLAARFALRGDVR